MLTLVVVPVLFTYIDNFGRWIMQLGQGGFGKKRQRKGKKFKTADERRYAVWPCAGVCYKSALNKEKLVAVLLPTGVEIMEGKLGFGYE